MGIQAALFNDVKMWPVAMPDSVRVRWDYSFRALRHLLTRQHDMDIEVDLQDGGANTNTLLDEPLPACLQALPKVPNDDGIGDGSACRGFGYRIKRMELSALPNVPLRSAVKFRRNCLSCGHALPKTLVVIEWSGVAC